MQADYEGFPVSHCGDCRGYWVTGTVLLDILDKREKQIPQEAIETAREWRRTQIPKTELNDELECPSCGRILNRSVYGYDSGIIIDRCLWGCGIWLDAGDLTALVAFDEVWEKKAREIFAEKNLQMVFDSTKNAPPDIIRRGFFGRSVIGWLADFFVDFLSK